MKIFSLYKTASIIPAAVSMGLALLYFIGDQLFGPEYQSEWLTKGSFYPYIFMVVLINGLIACLFSLSIFLLHYPTIRNNDYYRYAALGFPWLWPIYISLLIGMVHSTEQDLYAIVEGVFIFFIFTAPYFVGLYRVISRN